MLIFGLKFQKIESQFPIMFLWLLVKKSSRLMTVPYFGWAFFKDLMFFTLLTSAPLIGRGMKNR